jgi:hypothetical protein
MERPTFYIRLLIATVAAVGSTIFDLIYTRFSMRAEVMRLHLRRMDFPAVTTFVAYQGWYALVIPAGLLCLGVLAIHVWKSKATFELAAGGLWLFALFWLGCGLLVCLLPECQ